MASNPWLALQVNCIPEAYPRRMCKVHKNLVFRSMTLREFEEVDIGWHKGRFVQSRSNLTSVPPRMASFWASLRDGEFRTRSTFDCQLNGSSVPKTTCPEPTSATRWRRPSSVRTIVSTKIWLFMYSLGCFLFSQPDFGRT